MAMLTSNLVKIYILGNVVCVSRSLGHVFCIVRLSHILTCIAYAWTSLYNNVILRTL